MIRKILATHESLLADSVDNIEPFRILTGGEPLGRALGRRLQMLVPHVGVVDVYGLTETCSSDFFLREKDQVKFAGTIGHPGPRVQFRIADDQGRQLPIKQIGEHSNPYRFRYQIVQEPQLLDHHFLAEKIDASCVAARPSEAGDEAEPNRVFADTENDRDCPCCSFGRKCGGVAARRGDYGHLSADQIGHQVPQATVLTLEPVVLDHHVLAFNIAGFLQTLAEGGQILR